ncbi:MAG: hypothetical protein AB1918_10835 [Pseudomonadota bacterium]
MQSATTTLAVLAALVATAAPAGAQQGGQTPPGNEQRLIANAMSAAPRAVAEKATVAAIDDKGRMTTLRKGAGNFTCLPDNPTTPGNDPMCLDQNAVAWAQAWMSRSTPPQGKVGFGYMLQGGSDASNTDPFASAPTAGDKWVETGPHVMIFNAPGILEGYPVQATDTRVPYVMWNGTPYAHLMIPVGEPSRANASQGK